MDGQSTCKLCWRELNLTEGHAEACRRWRAKNPDKQRESTKAWRAANEGAVAAQSLVWYYIQKKVLERPENCQNCGTECKPEAHHEDYSKPLEVIWLCRLCHGLTKQRI